MASLASVFWLALGWAMAQSAVQIGAMVRVYLRSDSLQAFPVHRIWMIPVANVLFIGTSGVAVYFVSRVIGRKLSLRGAWTVVAWAAILGLMMQHLYSIHLVARLLLSGGIAYQIAAFATRRSERSLAWARRVGAVGATAVVLAFGVLWSLRALDVRRQLAGLSASDGDTNVLLLILDTVAARSLSLYGYERRTSPEIDAIAERGVTFDDAIAPAPWTLPTHASVLTGMYPFDLPVGWERGLDGAAPTLAQRLRDAGYATAGFVGNTTFVGSQWGFGRGFIRFDDFVLSPAAVFTSSPLGNFIARRIEAVKGRRFNRRDGSTLTRAALGWVREHGDHPYFVFINYYDAHAPYTPPAPYDRKFIIEEPESRALGLDGYTEVEANRLRDAYDGAVAYADHHVGQLLRTLEAEGHLENTLVVITSDHGEEFLEHGVMEHGHTLYLPALWVPLVMVGPGGIPAGRRVGGPVSLRDLAATILDVTGSPAESSLPGRSLRPLWAGSGAPIEISPALSNVAYARGLPERYPVSRGDMQSVISQEGLHLIRNGDGVEELYDVRTDPLETIDLVAVDTLQSRLGELRTELPPHDGGGGSR